jgi:hypothetical protein
MTRHLAAALIFSSLILAGPVLAAETKAPYQATEALKLHADAGKSNTAASDPLTDITRVDLVVRLSCAEANCDTASFGLSMDGVANEAAALTFAVGGDGRLQPTLTKVTGSGQGSGQPFKVALKPDESFDLRIHWNTGNRVTFDLYGRDPATGFDMMESHDVQLGDGVKQVSMRVSGGDLSLLKQSYSFR